VAFELESVEKAAAKRSSERRVVAAIATSL